MPESLKRIIDDIEFTIELMPTSTALDKNGPYAIVQNIIAPPMATWIESQINFNEGWLLEATVSYLTGFNQYGDINNLAYKLLNNCYATHVGVNKAGSGKITFEKNVGWDKDPFHYDNFFRGRYLTLAKLIGFALEVNYPDFFGKLSIIGQLLKGFMESEKNKSQQAQEATEVQEEEKSE